MKLLKHILLFVSLLLIIAFALQQDVNAKSSPYAGAKGFIEKGEQAQGQIFSQQKVEEDLQPIGNALYAVGLTVLLIVGLIMGVKYMISGADEKANMKQKLIWYVISAILIFSAVGVYNVVYNIITSATGK